MAFADPKPPSFRHIVLLAALAPSLVVVLLGLLLTWQLAQVSRAGAGVNQSLEVLRQINLVEAQLNAMEAGQRGLLLTGKPAFSRSFEAGAKALPGQLDQLEALLAERPADAERVAAWRQDAMRWLANARVEAALRRANSPRFQAVFEGGAGARLMEGLRADLGRYRAVERQALAARQADLERRLRLGLGLGLGACAAALAFMGTVGRRQLAAFAHLTGERAEQAELLDAAHDAIMVRAGEGSLIRYWNEGAIRLYGFTREEALGVESHALLKTRFPEPLAAIEATLAREGRWEGEVVQHTRAGRELVVESRWVRRPGAEGTWAVLEINRDVTAAREARRNELSAMRQADAQKDRFISIVSHELRTPINAMMAFASVLDDEVVGPLNAEQHAYLARVLAAADTLLLLVNDLLDMSRIQAGKFSIHPAPTALAEVADGVAERLGSLAVQRGLTLRLEVPADLPLLPLDAMRIGQVLTNLVGNALKFTPAGGTVTVSARREGDAVRCTVRDTGPGVPAAQRDGLFKPFSQAESDARLAGQGAGLGLSISKAIIEAHGGAIGLAPSNGEGASFWFTLPVREAVAANPQPPSQP